MAPESPNSISAPGSSALHSALVNELLLHLNQYGIFWKHPTGTARALHDSNQMIKFGLEGSPDIIGFLKNGKFCGFECKTGSATLSPMQKKFREIAIKYKTVHLICRNVEKTLQELEKYLAE